jgi:hypothetical protein
LNGAIEDILPALHSAGTTSLEAQTDFLAQCLTAWFEASGRFEKPSTKNGVPSINPENVTYQGRTLIAVLAVVPAAISYLKKNRVPLVSDNAAKRLIKWFRELAQRAGLLQKGIFIPKSRFQKRGYLGSGGIGRLRDILWAAVSGRKNLARMKPETVSALAATARKEILSP